MVGRFLATLLAITYKILITGVFALSNDYISFFSLRSFSVEMYCIENIKNASNIYVVVSNFHICSDWCNGSQCQ